MGLFLGGSTDWKLKTLMEWGNLSEQTGCYYHVARVNSVQRINHAIAAGADSIDGTSATKYAATAPRLGAAADTSQNNLPLWGMR